MFIQFNSTKLCRNIRYLRNKRRMTQKALAQCLRIEPIEVRHLESEKSLPVVDYDVLCRVSAFFGVGIEALAETDLSSCAHPVMEGTDPGMLGEYEKKA